MKGLNTRTKCLFRTVARSSVRRLACASLALSLGAGSAQAAGADVVVSDPVSLGNNEYYVTFTLKSGKTTDYLTWNVPANVTKIRYLVVGGGGGGGSLYGGGGGAGGFLTGTLTSGIASSYTIQVGSGGAGGSGAGKVGANGENSMFKNDAINFIQIAYGGGGGGSYNTAAGTGGASGGGGAPSKTAGHLSGGSSISGQGHDGGAANAEASAGGEGDARATLAARAPRLQTCPVMVVQGKQVISLARISHMLEVAEAVEITRFVRPAKDPQVAVMVRQQVARARQQVETRQQILVLAVAVAKRAQAAMVRTAS